MPMTEMDKEESSQMVYLSVLWQGGKLGVAYYDTDTAQMNIMLDALENDKFFTLKSVLLETIPTHVIISSKQDERLVNMVKSTVNKLVSEDLGSENAVEVIEILPSSDFVLETCKRRLLNLDLPSMPKHFLETEKILFLSSLIPFENICMIRAAGSLLKYLEKKRIGVELEDSGVRVPIFNLKIFSLKDRIIVDETSYSALQIFQKESHPSVYKSGKMSGTKEGMSLFGILNRCKSKIGSKLLRHWFYSPSKNHDVLKQRQDAISYFINLQNIETFKNLGDCLKKIRHISKILSRMLQAQASVTDWQTLYKTVYHAICIGDICRTQPQKIDIFHKIAHTFTKDLNQIATFINKIVDFDECITQNRFVVKPNIDFELDEKKRTYNGLPDFMTNVAREELNRLSDDITECNVIYLPQLGYLLAVSITEKMKADNFDVPGLEFVFLSNNMVHYKSASTRNLDRLLGDTQCEITDLETSIMLKLQNTILEHSKVLIDIMQHVAELDCLMALSLCAREFGYVRPMFSKDNIIHIIGGRHPLQEIWCSPFVPNNAVSGKSNGKIQILTGPNASGKSVFLKQLALIVFMAHIGSFVPAESCQIGTVDRIFTRIKSLESVSVGLSTFMLDLNQMSDALRNATAQSLVIVDEFGKGTENIDGLALLTASLKYWIDMNENCPHVVLCTHFHSVVKLLPLSPTVVYKTMETISNDEELVFLYQLIDGFTNSSFANHIAFQAGLPQEIIKRGKEIQELFKENKPVRRLDSATTDMQLKWCSTLGSRFMELDLEKDDLSNFLKNFILPTSKGWL